MPVEAQRRARFGPTLHRFFKFGLDLSEVPHFAGVEEHDLMHLVGLPRGQVMRGAVVGDQRHIQPGTAGQLEHLVRGSAACLLASRAFSWKQHFTSPRMRQSFSLKLDPNSG